MRDFAEVIVLVEGQTERRFIKEMLAPYLSFKHIFLKPIILQKPGVAGGDVKFARARNDIGIHLKQRGETWLTLLVDYYGIRSDWPGYAESRSQPSPALKAKVMCQHTAQRVEELFAEQDAARRFIPYVSMHEIEALLFSDSEMLAKGLGVAQSEVEKILRSCGEPEAINDNPNGAPSKRLDLLTTRFKKTTTGIEIARTIGIPKMRSACPLFDAWICKLESLVG
ncbi:MAG: DUF4276 family protein [Magnetococcales bacterium]|nr:DUF4276 family protein [Magnetococcales bacterium]